MTVSDPVAFVRSLLAAANQYSHPFFDVFWHAQSSCLPGDLVEASLVFACNQRGETLEPEDRFRHSGADCELAGAGYEMQVGLRASLDRHLDETRESPVFSGLFTRSYRPLHIRFGASR